MTPCILNAQQLQLNLIGSLSKEAGPDYDNFNWGFAVGGEAFFFLGSNVLLGAHVMYNRWAPDESAFTESIDDLISGSVEGNAFTLELLPSMRLTTRFPQSNVNIFAQSGAGLFVVNNRVTVDGTTSLDSAIQLTFGEDSHGRFGLNVGGGVSIGNLDFVTINVFPLFNLVFLGGGDTMRYFTFNLGLSLNI